MKVAASPNPTNVTTAALSALGGDNGGESALSYAWAVTDTAGNAAAVSFSANGHNAAKSV